jgi:uncharacterized protein YlxW (UPF0749 family)
MDGDMSVFFHNGQWRYRSRTGSPLLSAAKGYDTKQAAEHAEIEDLQNELEAYRQERNELLQRFEDARMAIAVFQWIKKPPR